MSFVCRYLLASPNACLSRCVSFTDRLRDLEQKKNDVVSLKVQNVRLLHYISEHYAVIKWQNDKCQSHSGGDYDSREEEHCVSVLSLTIQGVVSFLSFTPVSFWKHMMVI